MPDSKSQVPQDPREARGSGRWSLLLLLAVAGILFFLRLGHPGLLDPEEGRYAEIAREMVESRDWLIPHLNYIRYLEKPPLLYWCVAATYNLFGCNEFWGRFWSALPALLGIFAVYCWGRRFLSPRAGLVAGLVLATSPEYFALARTLELDMLFSTCLTIALLAAYLGFTEGNNRKRPFLVMWVALAAASLTKSPVAIVMLLLILGLYCVLSKQPASLGKIDWLMGGALFLCLTAPWFIAISLHNRHFADYYWLDQHVLRFFTDRSRLTKPIYYYVSVFAWGFFPWTLCLVAAAFARLLRGRERKPLSAPTLFLWCWVLAVFTTFSLSRAKLPTYILPMFPACALLVGGAFDEWLRNCRYPAQQRRLMGAWGSVVAAMFFFLLRFHDAPVCLWFASYAPRALLSQTESRSSLWRSCETIRPLARHIVEEWRPGDRIAEYGWYGPSLAFYTRQRIILINGWYELSWAARYDHGHYFLKGPQGLSLLLKQPERLFFVAARESFGDEVQASLADHVEALHANSKYVLYQGPRVNYSGPLGTTHNQRRSLHG